MPQVLVSAVVGAPVAEVWALLRDFSAIGGWHPALPGCRIEDGPADRVGCARVFPLAGNHRETLVSLDDRHRTMAFTFADEGGGLPVRNYVSTMTVRPVTVSDETFIEWRAQFDCDQSAEDKVVAQVEDGVLTPGLEALARRWPTAAGPVDPGRRRLKSI